MFRIDLGCGKNKKEGYFGIDIKNFNGVDLVHDCNYLIPLEDNCADEIIANHFLSSIEPHKRIHIMNEIWRLLKPNGIFRSYTASSDGRGAFQDPQHYSFWNANSFYYYTKDELRDLYDIKAKFDIIKLDTTIKDNYDVCFVTADLRAIKTPPKMKYSIVCATNDDNILYKNLLASPNIDKHQVILQKNHSNVCQAYNDGMKKVNENIVIFVHHDVYLPNGFFDQLEKSLKDLPVDWGVAGVAGLHGNHRYGWLMNRNSVWGKDENLPHVVDSLDELILIVRNGSIVFDENIPSSHHMFGTDVVCQFKEKGMKGYSIRAYLTHNCKMHRVYPQSFYDSAEYIKKKWPKYLPIVTTCTTISK